MSDLKSYANLWEIVVISISRYIPWISPKIIPLKPHYFPKGSLFQHPSHPQPGPPWGDWGSHPPWRKRWLCLVCLLVCHWVQNWSYPHTVVIWRGKIMENWNFWRMHLDHLGVVLRLQMASDTLQLLLLCHWRSPELVKHKGDDTGHPWRVLDFDRRLDWIFVGEKMAMGW